MIANHFTFEGVPTIPYTLHAVIWLPEDQNVTAVMQIAHGMTEHIGRYEAFAEYLTQRGIAVAGFDLRGHGHNVGVQAVYQQLVKNGVNQVQIELFEGARHDLLHEEKSGAAEKAKKLILEWMLKQ